MLPDRVTSKEILLIPLFFSHEETPNFLFLWQMHHGEVSYLFSHLFSHNRTLLQCFLISFKDKFSLSHNQTIQFGVGRVTRQKYFCVADLYFFFLQSQYSPKVSLDSIQRISWTEFIFTKLKYFLFFSSPSLFYNSETSFPPRTHAVRLSDMRAKLMKHQYYQQ